MTRVQRGLLGVILAGLLAAILATPAGSASVDDLVRDFQLVPVGGQDPPPLVLPGLDGTPVSLSGLEGQVVLLYFWATW